MREFFRLLLKYSMDLLKFNYRLRILFEINSIWRHHEYTRINILIFKSTADFDLHADKFHYFKSN